MTLTFFVAFVALRSQEKPNLAGAGKPSSSSAESARRKVQLEGGRFGDLTSTQNEAPLGGGKFQPDKKDPNEKAIKEFHKNWRDFPVESLKKMMEAADDKEKLAVQLIGAENGKENYGRSSQVGMAMFAWPGSFAKAISKTLGGENYRSRASIFSSSLIQQKDFDGLAKMQSSLNMGEVRATAGRYLVKSELLETNSLEKVFKRVENMEVPSDQEVALAELCMRMFHSQDLATEENVNTVLKLANEADVLERLEKILMFNPMARKIMLPEGGK